MRYHAMAGLLCLAVTVGVTETTFAAAAPSFLSLYNPNWNITLSDFGYSDLLLDETPGLEGREYLSGEWGAAVSYVRNGDSGGAGHVQNPTWLEPQFVFPDWHTNSDFDVETNIHEIGVNVQGLPVAQSVISNGDLRITQTFEMIDTIRGTPMGAAAASAGGAGASILSNRYVLKHTYTIQNVSGEDLQNLKLAQLLHGLNSTGGVYDDRVYAGDLASYSHDVTLYGDSQIIVIDGDGESASATVRDYLAFHSVEEPTAFEIGHYGISPVDDHASGKPSDGVHLSIEDDWQSDPYSSREGTDLFEPAQPWTGGAMRYSLGALGDGDSVSISLLLTIRTASLVTTGGGSGGGTGGGDENPVDGSCRGGAGNPTGIDFHFDDLIMPGAFFAEYEAADLAELEDRIDDGDFAALPFGLINGVVQLWELEFEGEYNGEITLRFGYDPSLLPAGFDESSLQIWHFNGLSWELLGGVVDALHNTITITTSSLSPFALSYGETSIPEPATLLLIACGAATLVRRRRAASHRNVTANTSAR